MTSENSAQIPRHSGFLESKAQKLLDVADVRINGHRPFDIQIHDSRLYARVFAHGSLGLGEGYMDGWWDVEALDQSLYRIIKGGLEDRVAWHQKVGRWMLGLMVNLQAGKRAYRIGERHYDLGDTLFEHMLDKNMMYSCGYWKNAADLDAAQEAKLDLCCRKLGLDRGMRLLDIGCGWGGMARYAAERYGVEVVGLTVSQRQAEYARQICKDLPVEILLQDYREHDGHYDRIVSIGMFEHVGHRNYRTYMNVVRKLLNRDGLMLLHTIGRNISLTRTDPWIEKYIFPNSMVPSPRQITKALEGVLVVEDWHNFGPDYDRTLMAWLRNFEQAWPELSTIYDERFYRMWRFYLCAAAAVFRARDNHLYQIVLSPNGVSGGYRSIR